MRKTTKRYSVRAYFVGVIIFALVGGGFIVVTLSDVRNTGSPFEKYTKGIGNDTSAFGKYTKGTGNDTPVFEKYTEGTGNDTAGTFEKYTEGTRNDSTGTFEKYTERTGNDTSAFEKYTKETGNDNPTVHYNNTLGYSVEAIARLTCKQVHEGMNLLKMKRLRFIEKFKNPCWYEDGTLQCLPYMYLVGVAKCGTTDLYGRLAMHPDFVKPVKKENYWLSYGRFCSTGNTQLVSYYSSIFSTLPKALSKSNNTDLITGDFSVNVLEGSHFWQCLGNNVGEDEPLEGNPEDIYHLNNQTRIVINVRNPIDRLWSEYLMFSIHETKPAELFHELVKRAVQIYRDCFKVRTSRSCMYDKHLAQLSLMPERAGPVNIGCSYRYDEKFYLRRGAYHVFIEDFLKVFPRQQVLVHRLEDVSDDTEISLKRLFTFLGLRPPTAYEMNRMLNLGVMNRRRRSSNVSMFEATRKMLYEFYKPYNEHLAILLNDSKFNYGPIGG